MTAGAEDDDDSAGDDDDSAGDDDDSAGDDDDSAGDDDDSASPADVPIEGAFVITYEDINPFSTLLCEQTLSWSGEARFGLGVLDPTCARCIGTLSLAPLSVLDVSDPLSEPPGCSGEVLQDVLGLPDWGARFTGPEGGNPWLEVPLLDLETAETLGFNPEDGWPLSAWVELLAADGLALTHIGFVGVSGTLFGPTDLDVPAAGGNAPDPSDDVVAFWYLTRPLGSVPPSTADPFEGTYGLGSFWKFNP